MKSMAGLFLVASLLLSGCIETDHENDPVVGERITVSHQTLALLPNAQVQVTAQYFDPYGIERSVPLVWSSTLPAVAEVNAQGLITAKANGQTIVQPMFGNYVGPQIQVTVASDPTAVAIVEVSPPSVTKLAVGASLQLDVSIKNVQGELLPDKVVEWFSENSSIATVSATGEVHAVSAGVVGIHAKSEGIKSNSINLTIDGLMRTGTFVSAGGYHTSGSASLSLVNNELILTLSSDFDTDFALGTYIYLANSTNGPLVRSSGFQVAQIFSDGAKTFNITQLNPSIGLNDYEYVVSLCYPASVAFGFAELK